MAKDERFVKIYSQGMRGVIEIWVDRKTGVNYIYRGCRDLGGGLTVLLDKDGKPVITPIED